MPLVENDVRHFLGRVGFAPSDADVNAFVGLEPEAVVDQILNIERDLPAQPDWLGVDNNGLANRKTLDWWLNRMIESRWINAPEWTPNPLVEKLAMFWHGHFATEASSVNDATVMWEQNQIFRTHALGDFETMCQEVSFHGAMLVYLDNASNVKGAVQENFARELMELFTMGIGHYTQDDVVSMARAWTGHGIVGWDPVAEERDETYQFRANRHDEELKTLFGIEKNWDAADTITEIVRGSRQRETANFLTTKLWRFFVSGNAPADAVNDIATAFINADMDIKALMRALLLRPEFWAQSNRRALVKSPSQYVVDFYRCVGLYFEEQQSSWFMRPMGQELLEPPNVAGWGTNGYWLSTATMWGRARFASDRRWKATSERDFLNEIFEMDEIAGADHLLRTFRIHDPSDATREALQSWFVKTKPTNEWALRPVGISVTALTPEFQVI